MKKNDFELCIFRCIFLVKNSLYGSHVHHWCTARALAHCLSYDACVWGVVQQLVHITSPMYQRFVSIFWLMLLCPSPNNWTRVSVLIVNNHTQIKKKGEKYIKINRKNMPEFIFMLHNSEYEKKKQWPTSKQISSWLGHWVILKSDIVFTDYMPRFVSFFFSIFCLSCFRLRNQIANVYTEDTVESNQKKIGENVETKIESMMQRDGRRVKDEEIKMEKEEEIQTSCDIIFVFRHRKIFTIVIWT